jgi:FlaA1/EpsC-like NDP-sugar epimerase
MREGEKLNESLFSEHEQALPTAHPRIFRTVSEQRVVGLHQKLRSLYDAAARNDVDAVRLYLRSILPDYHPEVPTTPVQFAVPYADDY